MSAREEWREAWRWVRGAARHGRALDGMNMTWASWAVVAMAEARRFARRRRDPLHRIGDARRLAGQSADDHRRYCREALA